MQIQEAMRQSAEDARARTELEGAASPTQRPSYAAVVKARRMLPAASKPPRKIRLAVRCLQITSVIVI